MKKELGPMTYMMKTRRPQGIDRSNLISIRMTLESSIEERENSDRFNWNGNWEGPLDDGGTEFSEYYLEFVKQIMRRTNIRKDSDSDSMFQSPQNRVEEHVNDFIITMAEKYLNELIEDNRPEYIGLLYEWYWRFGTKDLEESEYFESKRFKNLSERQSKYIKREEEWNEKS